MKEFIGCKYLSKYLKISKKVRGVEYAIRDIVSAAREVENAGKKVEYLNIGDPVQFGFQPPDNVKQALIKAIQDGQNYYGPSEGLPELRNAVAEKENAKGLDSGPVPEKKPSEEEEEVK